MSTAVRAASATLVLLAAVTARAAVLTPPAASVEIDRLSAQNPSAGAMVRRAEGALAAGDVAGAAELYRQARRLAPLSGFADRRHCQMLAELGQRDAAVAACRLALEHGATVLDLRAMVGALMSGPQAPSVADVMDASTMAAGAKRLRSGDVGGYAAFEDIARRLDDRPLVATYLAELQRVAPGDPETRRALALAPRAWLWARGLGWAALLVLCGLALRRRGAIALAVLLAWSAGARAQDGDKQPPADHISSYELNEADPENHLPTKAEIDANPLQFGYLLMDLASKADGAASKGDHQTAAKYYRALAKAVPERSIAFGQLCREYEALGLRKEGVEACRAALGRPGVRVEDYSRYVRLLLDHPGSLTAAEKGDATEIIKHLRADPATRAGADDVQCQLGARLVDARLLDECVAGLVVAAPRDPKTIAYQWTLAMARRDRAGATRQLERAKAAGIKPEGIARMEEGLRKLEARRRLPLVGAAALLAIGALLATYLWRRSSTPPSPPNSPSAPSSGERVGARGRRSRKVADPSP
jgi:hypothetical protein